MVFSYFTSRIISIRDTRSCNPFVSEGTVPDMISTLTKRRVKYSPKKNETTERVKNKIIIFVTFRRFFSPSAVFVFAPSRRTFFFFFPGTSCVQRRRQSPFCPLSDCIAGALWFLFSPLCPGSKTIFLVRDRRR